MSKIIKIKKGLDIKLFGVAEKKLSEHQSEFYAFKPTDYHGIIPKLMVNMGDSVKAGTTLFIDKSNEKVRFVSSVSGVVHDIVRGEKRKLLEIVIKADTSNNFESLKFDSSSKQAVIDSMLNGGLWPMVRQRPYNIVTNPESSPKAIFISAFDSAPLAPELDFILEKEVENLQKGLDILKIAGQCPVNIGISAEKSNAALFGKLKGVVINQFAGPHPAGNVGIQIHHINPVLKGDVVWTITIQDVISIGRSFNENRYSASKVVALTGSEVKNPQYFVVKYGASVKTMFDNNLKIDNVRIISGNVLTGEKISNSGFIGAFHQQITAIPEGDYYEFFGWALPGLKKFSISKTFFNWLTPNKPLKIDTNLHGEHRAFVMSNQYDKVLPMNIFPVVLLKASLAQNIEKMEQLGIYEIDEEDFALCEVVCTSKIDVQQIVRDGLDLIRKEMN